MISGSTYRSLAATSLTAALMLFAFGCASTPPSQQLVNARSAYDEASKSQTKSLNPRDLHVAKGALDEAERAHKRDPGSQREMDLAYIAERKVQLASVRAGGAMARKEHERAKEAYTNTLEGKVSQTAKERDAVRQERDAVKNELQKTEAELQREREALKKTENQLKAALASLKELASVKEEARGLVITLSGSVLFKTGSATLLPVAEQKLDEVAKALSGYGAEQPIIIEGHTDSRGSERYNNDLSKRRAESVRTYLLSQGMDADQVKAVGKGEAMPIADNKTTEGRANNRRVEIVVPGQAAAKSSM